MHSKEFLLNFDDVKALVERKLEKNREFSPKIRFIKHLASYSVTIPSLTRMSNEELSKAEENGEEIYMDTIIVPALPRSLKTEDNLSSLKCRFSYSQKPCSISPATHYDLLSKIFGYERCQEVNIFADRFCLRRLIDFALGSSNSENADIMVSTKLRVDNQGEVRKISPIKMLPININEGFPSVGFQFETFLTRSEIGLGLNPDAVLKMADSCFVVDEIFFGDLKLVRRCEIDAVRKQHVYGNSKERSKQEEHRNSLCHKNWEQKIYNTNTENMEKRMCPPCRVFLSDNFNSSNLSPENRVEIKSISCRNTHNFSWVSVYFQMLIGSTPLLIRGCHNRGFFMQGSISSFSLDQVKEFSGKELGTQKRSNLDFPESNWDTLTSAIAFSEAILLYMSNDLLDLIGSYLLKESGPGDHFVNFTIKKKQNNIIFQLLNPNDNLPNIAGPINYWNNYLSTK
ncbi:uncharacterized protein cubi_02796 [Cryptosporidium ubiquitum]|uniref:Uncharacterized protein n=1 Tax=Cryptosporidium ubiquitum TaxID=857276 RepID=A0A1J4MIB4_9CRYT|nr:uncharacterized protein cubi_02796 [Cryptosporidium ubiquitum]OII73994.1 hypothetical protein cubi_02796 [Cryptosporidium ubiquitum]